MRIAILVLAHRSKEQLEVLINQLNHPDISVYLHLDKKADFGYTDINAHFFPIFPQLICSWGGYNVTRATFRLLEKAFNDGFDYFVLISGEDFPLRSNFELVRFFKKNQGKSFINLVAFEDIHLDPLVNAEYFKKRFLFVHVPRRGPKNIFERIWFSLLVRIRNLQKRYTCLHLPIPSGIVAGENWFNLYRYDVEQLLESYRRAWGLRIRLSFGLLMEEVLPHTLLQYLKEKDHWRNDSLRFTIWKQDTSSPEYLTKEDLIQAFQSDELFARKINDKELIRFLQQQIKSSIDSKFM